MDKAIQQTSDEEWKQFRDNPFSQRVLNFFTNAEINSVGQLTTITAQELQKYRNVGRSAMMEIRLALARMNLSLEGEPVYQLLELDESNDLKTRLKALEQRRDEMLIQIQRLKVQIAAQSPIPIKRKPPKNPELDKKLLARWKEMRDYKIVSEEFGVTVNKVRTVVIGRFA